MAQKIRHKRSGILNKKPNASQLELGEIAINFNSQNPFISTLTSDGTVAEFPSKEGVQGLIDDALEEYQPGSGGTVDAYTKAETDQLLAGKSDSGHTHPQYLTEHQDISNLATKDELAGKSDSGHTHPQYLTEHQDISGKADKSELENYQPVSGMSAYAPSSHTHSQYLTQQSADERYAQKGDTPTDVYTKTETDQLLAGKANSAHTHDYETLTNKPDLSNFATKGEIPDTSNFITSGFCEDHYQPKGTYVVPSDLNDYALKSEVPDSYTKTETDNLLAGKANSSHTHSYNDLTDKPTIPSIEGLETSQHASETYQPKGDYLTEHQDISGKADKTDLANYQPISAMTGYLTTSDAASTYQPKGDYLTEHQDISGKADKSDLANYLTTSAATNTYATKDELAGKSDSAHTHTSSDITDLSTVLAGYSTSAHTHPQYVTSGDVEEMLSEFTPTGSTGNVWHGTYAEYIALAEKDNDTLYCITDVSQQYMTRGEADALYMPLSGMTDYQPLSGMTDYQTVANMSGYVTTSAATATYATKTELSGYARVVSISQSDYDTLVSNDQVQQGVLYCIIESSN